MNADGCMTNNEKGCTTTDQCCYHPVNICASTIGRPTACFVLCDADHTSICTDLGDYICAQDNYYGDSKCMKKCVDSDQCSEGFSFNAKYGICLPCWETGESCTTSDTCCDGLNCTDGICSKGFSLFDMSFSLKHLVGIAVVMVATWSL